MTRKDFVLIAATLKASKPPAGMLDHHTQWHFGCCKMADALATTNAAFDRLRFLQACDAA